MKIIQSFWSKPFFEGEMADEKKRFLLFSWLFSCLQLRKFYKDVHLITDEKGKELLIDILKIPYTSFTVALNEIDRYDHDLWAIGKLYAYQLQDEPFLHVDGDLFIWESFNKRIEASSLVALHPEPDVYHHYNNAMEEIRVKFRSMPACLDQIDLSAGLTAINAAIIGGKDTHFFKRYTELAFKFVDENTPVYKSLTNKSFFNCIFEQLLFYYLADDTRDIDFYFPEETSQLYSFCDIPHKHKVIHARSDKRITYTLETRLYHYMMLVYPDYFYAMQKRLPDLVLLR